MHVHMQVPRPDISKFPHWWPPQAGPNCCKSRWPCRVLEPVSSKPHEVGGFVALPLVLRWARRRRAPSRNPRRTILGVTGQESWVAPLVKAAGAPGQGNLALGALQCTADGPALLHGQVYNEDANAWTPVLLQRVGATSLWQDRDLTVELPMQGLTDSMHQQDLAKELPTWPASLRRSLEAWPLKGPGTVIFDPHFFVQRAAALTLMGPGPVVFPGAADAMNLPSTSQRCAQHSFLVCHHPSL